MKTETALILAAAVVVVAIIVSVTFEGYYKRVLSLEQAALDNNQFALELDQATAKLQGLIEVERARMPAGTAYGAPPPVEFGSIEWQADIRVKIQYLRWQIEFLITLRSLDGGKPPGGKGRPIGQVIGETNQ